MVARVDAVTQASRRYWPLALVLVYWGTRLHSLDALPIFLDEGIHIDWARLVWRLQPFHAASDGKLLSIWLQAAFWPFAGTLWIARASTVVAASVGFAALLALGRRLGSDLASVLAGCFFVLMPLSVFFDRMALVDSVSAAEVTVLVFATTLAMKSPSAGKAAVAGLVLTLVLLTKLPNLVFIVVPLLGGLALARRGRRIEGLRQVGLMYVGSLVTLAPAVIVLRTIGHSDLGLDLLVLKTGSGELGVLESARTSFGTIAGMFWTMAIPGLVLMTGTGIVLAFWRRKPQAIFFSLVFALSLSALSGRSGAGFLESRYLMVSAPLAVLLAALAVEAVWAGMSRVAGRAGRSDRLVAVRGAIILGLVWLLWPGLTFLRQAWHRPEELPLSGMEQWEYFTGWPSGYGFREIARQYVERAEPVQLVTFDLGGRQRFQSYLPPHSPVTPVWIGSEQFAAGVRPNASLGPALLVLDHPKDDRDLAQAGLKLAEVATYPRPGGNSWLTVYEFR